MKMKGHGPEKADTSTGAHATKMPGKISVAAEAKSGGIRWPKKPS